jgi:O-antigen/teichoic acid export membrane protein
MSELLAGSLWPAYGEAAVRGDWNWVRRAFRAGTTATMLVAGLAAILGAAAGDDVVRIWTPKIPVPSHGLFLWLAVWLLGQGGIAATGTLLCGLNRNRLLMWTTLVEGSMTIGLSAYYVSGHGIAAVAACMASCSVVAAVVLAALAVPRVTAGNVFVDRGLAARTAASIVASACAGWLFRSIASPLPVIARVVFVSIGTTALYTALAWWCVLSADERARLATALRRRLGRGQTVP